MKHDPPTQTFMLGVGMPNLEMLAQHSHPYVLVIRIVVMEKFRTKNK